MLSGLLWSKFKKGRMLRRFKFIKELISKRDYNFVYVPDNLVLFLGKILFFNKQRDVL